MGILTMSHTGAKSAAIGLIVVKPEPLLNPRADTTQEAKPHPEAESLYFADAEAHSLFTSSLFALRRYLD